MTNHIELINKYRADLHRAKKRLQDATHVVDQLEKVVADLEKATVPKAGAK